MAKVINMPIAQKNSIVLVPQVHKFLSKKTILMLAATIFSIIMLHLSAIATTQNPENTIGDSTLQTNSVEGEILQSYFHTFSSDLSGLDSRISNYKIENITSITVSENENSFFANISVKPSSNRSIWSERLGSTGFDGWTPSRKVKIDAVREGSRFVIKNMQIY